MPRKRKTTKVRRHANEAGLKVFLISGHDFFHELTDEIMEDDELLRSYWIRWRDELTEERMRTHPGTRCWAWWHYDRGIEERLDHNEQREYLEAHGLLSEEEQPRLAEWDRKRAAIRQR